MIEVFRTVVVVVVRRIVVEGVRGIVEAVL